MRRLFRVASSWARLVSARAEDVNSYRTGGRARRILIFSPAPSDPGGAEKRTRLLASSLAERGWGVRVIARSRARRPRLTRDAGLTVVEIPSFRYSRAGTLLYLAASIVLGLIWGLGSSVLLAINLYAPLTAAAICARVLRRPYLALSTTSGEASEAAYLLNDDLSRRGRWSPRAYGIDRRLRRSFLRRAAFVVPQSDAAASELAGLVLADRLAVVPTPVCLLSDPPPLDGAPTVLFAGRFSREKGVLDLLQAWPLVVAEYQDATLTLAGASIQGESIEDEVRQLVTRDVTLGATVSLTGWVPNVMPLLARSDVFVLPSLPFQEGMSNVLLEACASARVVVASDIPANRAVLGDDYPLLFPPGDIDRLGESLLRALGDGPIRARARAAVLERAAAFSVDSVISRLEKVLETAIAGTPAPSQWKRAEQPTSG